MPRRLAGAAAEAVARKYGFDVSDADSVESVGTSAAEVLRNDPDRVFVLLVNLSLNTVYVGFDQGVGSSLGIVLASNGGSYQADVEEDMTLPSRSMFAVATGASSSLYVLTLRRLSNVVAPEV